MRFWDSSAIAPLLLEQDQTTKLRKTYQEDHKQIVWCLTPVEIASAIARRSREGLEQEGVQRAKADLQELAERWEEVISLDLVRARAIRLLSTHPLRAADAIQLAAALVASDERPESLPFVCLDDRLRDAARREGFKVLPA